MDSTLLAVILGISLPFVGTTLGAATVLFLPNGLKANAQKLMLGFASGVMLAASIWSLILPAMALAQERGQIPWIPASIGFLLGILFLLALDLIIPHLHIHADKPEGMRAGFSRTTMLFLAITLHNLPEGMAVGVVFAGALSGEVSLPLSAGIALAIGIALQNIPEGAIISMPLASAGKTRKHAFIMGTSSGLVEPIGAVLAIFLASLVTPALPYILCFAAGAMVYVVVEELIPEIQTGTHTHLGTIGMSLGFVLMLILDTSL